MSWKASRFAKAHMAYPRREKMTKHHRKPTSRGGGNGDNISELPRSLHEAWHILFRDFSPERIAEEINLKYLDTNYEMVAVKKSRKYTRGAE